MNKTRSYSYRLKRAMLFGVVIGVMAGVLFTVLIANRVSSKMKSEFELAKAELIDENKKLKQEIGKQKALGNSTEVLKSKGDEWSLALVNESNPIDLNYQPESMVEIDSERSVDARIEPALKEMMDDGAKQGLQMYVASAYRSSTQQTDVFNTTMQDWINKGYTPLAAYDETKKSVAVPGTSEHATGLAVDIISADYTELDEKQGDTPEQKWLMEHCWEYGFILRYPPEKSDITGIIYEPWHYRYVGKEAAKEITENNLTLEEYLLD